ncbi:MAG: DUF3089 domain-containing protein [Deltaproteobacteria bacterium]|nr:MAG: DUF3089 domain-containing protein [Deltaproteobacteria bacterium]
MEIQTFANEMWPRVAFLCLKGLKKALVKKDRCPWIDFGSGSGHNNAANWNVEPGFVRRRSMAEKSKKKRWPWIVGVLVVLLVAGYVFRRPLLGAVMVWWITPSKAFDTYKPPAKPDYSKSESWSALPNRKDFSDFVPTGVVSSKKPRPADVFFIHPTTYFGSKHWNAPLDAPKAMRRVNVAVTKHQASSFNECCRVFAPRYRQATLAFAFKFKPNGKKALELAYSDVVRAFQHYMKHWNKGRPFLIAGHSQGSIHGIRLLEEHIASKPIRKQLVAAYLAGNPVHSDKFKRTLKPLVPCETPTSTGCVASWLTLGKGAGSVRRYSRLPKFYPPKGYEDVSKRPHICTNPISWKGEGGMTQAAEHLGAIPYTKKKNPIPKPFVGAVQGACKDGAFVITKPKAKGFNRFLFGPGDYHIYDYHLFYMNIRKNAVDRVQAFLKKQSKPAAR